VTAYNYSYIDVTESIGNTTQVVIKGTGQVIAHTADTAMNPANGLIELLGVGLVLAAIVFVIGYAVKTKQHAGKLF
jgi:hypothetical protein